MPGEEVKLGPFVGGLNTFSDPTAIDDLELTICDNFDMYHDGSLVNRPPIHDLGVTMSDISSGSDGIRLIGWYVATTGATYLLGTNNKDRTFYFDGTSWNLITSTFAASAVAQYRDKAWLVAPPGSANPGGKWDPVAGFDAVNDMPKGNTIAVQKERLWIGPGKGVATNGSRIYFCPPSDPDTWSGDFITVNTGDGQNVVEVTVYFQDLLIFKSNSTYRFSYDIDPALGTISRVSDTVGVFDKNCVASFENRIFVLHDSHLYELSNYNYDRLNDRVPFRASNTSTSLTDVAALSYFANRIFVSYYDQLYVWSVRTRTWSTWSSDVVGNIGKIMAEPGAQDNEPRAFTVSRDLLSTKLYEIVDGVTTNSEDMVCTLRTKNYDYQTASRFKKLFSWGIDCVARKDIEGIVEPVQFAATVTWGQVKNYTWGEIKNSSWGRLLGSSTRRVDPVTISGVTGERKFIKLGDRTLRFRQVAFEVRMVTNGTAQQAPASLFNIITWVTDKQAVVKRIS